MHFSYSHRTIELKLNPTLFWQRKKNVTYSGIFNKTNNTHRKCYTYMYVYMMFLKFKTFLNLTDQNTRKRSIHWNQSGNYSFAWIFAEIRIESSSAHQMRNAPSFMEESGFDGEFIIWRVGSLHFTPQHRRQRRIENWRGRNARLQW